MRAPPLFLEDTDERNGEEGNPTMYATTGSDTANSWYGDVDDIYHDRTCTIHPTQFQGEDVESEGESEADHEPVPSTPNNWCAIETRDDDGDEDDDENDQADTTVITTKRKLSDIESSDNNPITETSTNDREGSSVEY